MISFETFELIIFQKLIPQKRGLAYVIAIRSGLGLIYFYEIYILVGVRGEIGFVVVMMRRDIFLVGRYIYVIYCGGLVDGLYLLDSLCVLGSGVAFLNGCNGEWTNADDRPEMSQTRQMLLVRALIYIIQQIRTTPWVYLVSETWALSTELSDGVEVVAMIRPGATIFICELRFYGPDPFITRGTLNGNNGSWTNTDDVDEERQRRNDFYHQRNRRRVEEVLDLVARERRRDIDLADRERAAREANNRIHHQVQGRDRHGNVEFGPPGGPDEQRANLVIGEELAGGALPRDFQPPPAREPRVEEVLEGIFVRSDVPDALYECDAQHKEVTLDHMLTRFREVPRGALIPCKKCGLGWALVSNIAANNKEVFRAEAATQQYVLQGYSLRDAAGVYVCYPEKTYNVYLPLFNMLNKVYKMSKPDHSVFNAATANCTSIYGEHPISYSTLDYYFHLINSRYARKINSTDVQQMVTNNAQTIGSGDFGLMNNIYLNTPLVDTKQPMRIDDVDCDTDEGGNLQLDWEIRDDFIVTQANGVRIQRPGEEFVFEDAPELVAGNERLAGYPRFSVVRRRQRYSTAFFELRGLNQRNFVSYKNSAINLTHGLKRLIGKRVDEDIYRVNAIGLGLSLKQELGSLFWTRGTDINTVHDLLVGDRGELRRRAGNLEAAQKTKYRFISRQAKKLWNDCNRTKIAKFLDGYENLKHKGYYMVYKYALTHFASWFSRETLARLAIVNRELRTRYVNGHKLSDEDELMLKSLDAQIKRELAKFSKVPRLYTAYGAGCMYANELPEFVKIGIDGVHMVEHNGVVMLINIMAKPKKDSMSTIFKELYSALSATDFVYVAIFSDDMVMSGNVNGASFCTNVDISSNDSSQDVPAFLLTFACMANFHPRRAKGLIEQCLQPIRIRDPEDNTCSMTIKFKGPFEGSGTVLTSVLNHLGSYLISVCTLYNLATIRPNTESDINEVIVHSAREVGHLVTIDSCYDEGYLNFSHVQFLKRSPFRGQDGMLHEFTNLGCILRCFGKVEDDLQAEQLNVPHAQFVSMTHDQRIDHFCSAVVRGWCHEPTNPIMRALRTRFCSGNAEVKHDSLTYVFEDQLDRSLMDNTEAIMSRYQCTLDEINELAEVILNLRCGHFSRTTMMAKILNVDYGVAYDI